VTEQTGGLPAGLLALLELSGGRDVRVVPAAPTKRGRIAHALRRSGYHVVHALPRGVQTNELVSIDAAALRFAEAANRLTELLGASVLRRLAPGVVLVASRSRSGATNPFVLRLSPAQERGYAYRFDADERLPASVTKIGLTEDGAARLASEAAALRELAPLAGGAGIVVPELLDWTPAGDRPVLVETFVAGEQAARVLARSARSLDRIVSSLREWLVWWISAGPTTADRPGDVVEVRLLRPVRELAAVLPSAFVDSVEAQGKQLTKGSVRSAAAHNDLTMWNVLVRDDGRLAVLDWEAAAVDSLPLVDLFYAVVDAVGATTGYRSRRESLRACFHREGPRLAWARSVVAGAAREAGVDDDTLRASFLSCWLQHARNELQRGDASGFLSLLEDLAAAPQSFWPLGDHAG
jgi:Ser/Thr protein kinase RdoA (MazF antagonist)